jgi:DNA-binding MarR family transcriptional regulator
MAARLMVAIQEELYERLAEAGHDQINYLHGAVIAHLDEEGNRATVLARRSGRHKQVIGRLVDELEELGYVERQPEKVDRRGKKVVPTSKGLGLMRLSDSIVADIESRQEELVGEERYEVFRETLHTVVDSLSNRETR